MRLFIDQLEPILSGLVLRKSDALNLQGDGKSADSTWGKHDL
jgi:hypothetical protein